MVAKNAIFTTFTLMLNKYLEFVWDKIDFTIGDVLDINYYLGFEESNIPCEIHNFIIVFRVKNDYDEWNASSRIFTEEYSSKEKKFELEDIKRVVRVFENRIDVFDVVGIIIADNIKAVNEKNVLSGVCIYALKHDLL